MDGITIHSNSLCARVTTAQDDLIPAKIERPKGKGHERNQLAVSIDALGEMLKPT
jgi:hypothetical protein